MRRGRKRHGQGAWTAYARAYPVLLRSHNSAVVVDALPTDEAVRCSDEFRRMALVSAFTMSAFASGAYRTGKPFNPLLGETFELERSKTKGYRAIVEQVRLTLPRLLLFCPSLLVSASD